MPERPEFFFDMVSVAVPRSWSAEVLPYCSMSAQKLTAPPLDHHLPSGVRLLHAPLPKHTIDDSIRFVDRCIFLRYSMIQTRTYIIHFQ